ncbi:MAG: ABC transporter permease [Defluviitaleaceae bacterium]|nr:ABC transporter permease [Defluviitaleaceae bacterium]
MTRFFSKIIVVLKPFYLGLMLFFMYAPIAVLIIFSFNDSRSRGTWEGFSFRWYEQLFNDPHTQSALRNTILLAIFSTIFATLIGTLAAIGIDRMKKRSRTVVMLISRVPVMMPDVITGISLMMLFQFVFRMLGFGGLGFGTMLLAHIVFNVPYVILSVTPKIRQLDPNLYEAALDLGSNPARAFFQVILPELWPGVITGAMLAFTMSVDDFMVSFFTTSPGVQNLSIRIFSMTRRGVDPSINALSTIIFVVVMIMLILINLRDKHLITKRGEDGNEN